MEPAKCWIFSDSVIHVKLEVHVYIYIDMEDHGIIDNYNKISILMEPAKRWIFPDPVIYNIVYTCEPKKSASF